ncbi:hypothetical protein ACFCX4_27875 [Kitasatospora sp. NPDC056327]|uniref:allene oxide cyclase barrel-like domain-containing protein n=1 Tax=Kitasatospora sp. NPDC056327 TaxID=3345785 RepID=UPI0035D66D64
MRNKLPRPAVLAAATVSIVALASGLGGSAFADAAQGKKHPESPACVVFKDLPEFVTSMDYHDQAPAGPSVGDFGFYTDEVKDASGAKVADVVGTGRILYQRETDGHLIIHYNDVVTFANGSKVSAIGTADVNALIGGAGVSQALIGTKGRYKGWYGTREWTRVSQKEALVTMTLCKDPAKA